MSVWTRGYHDPSQGGKDKELKNNSVHEKGKNKIKQKRPFTYNSQV